jgi:hypothetical protein
MSCGDNGISINDMQLSIVAPFSTQTNTLLTIQIAQVIFYGFINGNDGNHPAKLVKQ